MNNTCPDMIPVFSAKTPAANGVQKDGYSLAVAVLLIMCTSLSGITGQPMTSSKVEPPSNLLDRLEAKIKNFVPDPKYPGDCFALVVLQEAVLAAREGNYGIGACLVRENGEIVQKGHNRVFAPYFRSDLHAEMDVLTRYEERMRAGESKVEGLTLYTSVEPCPMCLARIITAGVKKVYYLTPDPAGGMVHKFNDLPAVWQEIAKGRKYVSARCSPELKEIAFQVFHYSVTVLDRKLKSN